MLVATVAYNQCCALDAGGLICCIGVVTVEWWKLGQLRPGDKLRFVEPTLASLPGHLKKQESWIANLASSPCSFPLDVENETTQPPRTDGILKVIETSGDDPKISFRQAGDGGILVEVGERALSFRTRLITELYERKMREFNLPCEPHRRPPLVQFSTHPFPGFSSHVRSRGSFIARTSWILFQCSSPRTQC